MAVSGAMKQEIDRLIDEVGLPQASGQRRVAAILFTYRCSIACRHCLFGCAGDRPDRVMTPRQCADGLALLHETGRVVHIAGGEAMLYWEALADSIRLAHQEGHAPHFVETNCSFAVNDGVVRERFAFMAAKGVKGIYASADPFHQEFVSPERFLRVRRLAKEIFGPARFYGPENTDDEIRGLADVFKEEGRLRQYVREHQPVIVGTAHQRLARYLDRLSPLDSRLPSRGWRGQRTEAGCRQDFQAETLWELHIDPYGNIQTNCGIILGRVPDTTPARVLAEGPEKANRFVEVVCEQGALGLAEWARAEHGFVLPETVTQACELCYLVRCFLSRLYPSVFGPEEVYA